MAMQKVSVLVPPLRPEPRGAVLVGAAVDLLLAAEVRLRVWLVARLEIRRARRARVRAVHRDARDRAELIALAQRYESSQPEFAKDLFAAAKRDLSA